MAFTSDQTFKYVILMQYIHSKWKKLIDQYNLMTVLMIKVENWEKKCCNIETSP